MRHLSTVFTIALSIFLVTKMSFGQAIKVNSSGNIGINGDPGTEILKVGGSMKVTQDASFSGNVGINSAVDASYDLAVDGDMKITNNIAGHDSYSSHGHMTFSDNYITTEIVEGTQTTWALYVVGDAGGWYDWNVSDRKLKNNLQYLNENKMLNKIRSIRGRKYQFKDREELIQMHENNQIRFSVDTIDLESEKENFMNDNDSISDSVLKQKLGYDKTIMLDGKKYGLRIAAPDLSGKDRYGLIAQEIEDEFPELVKYDPTRMQYSINYDGFVPVLLEALKAQQHIIDTNKSQLTEDQNQINQQQQRITELEQLVHQQQNEITALQAQVDTILAQCCSNTVKNKSNPTGTMKMNEAPQAQLYQNIPNPFTENTRIEYFLPESTGEAQLYIYDMQGSQVENFQINAFGEGSITLQGGSMQPGMYMYTLIADGGVVDTKRMILTK